MKLNHGLHLAYCTNVHRGDTWEETWRALREHTLAVRRRVAAGRSYAIGLRLSHRAACELSLGDNLDAFRRWMDAEDCYVFTINGFPYGSFHGSRVKEQVYAPDWSTPERLDYTSLLFELLVKLVPRGASGSVSSVPGSFKPWIVLDAERRAAIFRNLTAAGRYIAELADRSGCDLHLGLEPEPCCQFETSEETVKFFDAWRASDAAVVADNLLKRVGVNYDCCHLAVEYENARPALDRLRAAGLRLSKLHISSALRLHPDEDGLAALAKFDEPVYFHQVVVNDTRTDRIRRYVDLRYALVDAEGYLPDKEWRVHFHLPLHAAPGSPFMDTREHVLEAFDWMAGNPGVIEHAEMETYTWEVLPPGLRIGIEEQLVREYAWTLRGLASRGLAEETLAATVEAARRL
ncbi:MAG: metabolite traffic protein EboE [Opitutaceae bacterium]|nr:metabolite traffic protein EboE [Opitutaceae bacterium]